MKVKDKLAEYYERSPFGVDGGVSNEQALVYAGPYFINIPNTPKRKELIPYHDLHHLIAGYSNSRIGEGEVGAWELGTGCWNKPLSVFLNVSAMATGIMYSPMRMAKAFEKGCSCRNLYDLVLMDVLEADYQQIVRYVAKGNKEADTRLLDKASFLPYIILAACMAPFLYLVGYMTNLRPNA